MLSACLRRILITLIASVALLSVVLIVGGCVSSRSKIPAEPVEPILPEEVVEESYFLKGRFSFLSPDFSIFDLSLDRGGEGILFGSSAKVVSLLNKEGRLRWEMSFGDFPYHARITPDGQNIVVGTSGGVLYFLAVDGEDNVTLSWEKELGKGIEHMAVSADGELIAVGAGSEETAEHMLLLFNGYGDLLWQKETVPLQSLGLTASGEKLYISKIKEGVSSLFCYETISGELLWVKEGLLLAAFSRAGDFLVATCDQKQEIIYIDSLGQELWRRRLLVAPSQVEMSGRGEFIAVYSEFGGAQENLFFYNSKGEQLWRKRIPDGSIIALAAGGERVMSSSWHDYRDDLTEIKVFDARGQEKQSMEIASRIDKMSLAENGRYLALASRDGSVYIFDLFMMREKADESRQHIYYRPVSSGYDPKVRRLTLYFYDENAQHLIPVTRTVNYTKAVLQTAVAELVLGPRRGSYLNRPIPKGAEIGVMMEAGTAYLDLPEELNLLRGSAQSIGILNSLLYTASQFPTVRDVRFLVEGETVELFGEGLDIASPFPARRFDLVGSIFYLPYSSGERYYLLPQEVAPHGGMDTRESARTSEHLAAHSHLIEVIKVLLERAAYFLPQGVSLIDLYVDGEKTTIDLSASFKELFPAEKDERTLARATLVLDALVYTIARNHDSDTVIITVEGERWSPPEGYPPLEQQIKRPYHLNPE